MGSDDQRIEKKSDLDQYADLLWGKNEKPPQAKAAPTAAGARAGRRYSQVRLVMLIDQSYSMYSHRYRMRSGLTQFFDAIDQSVPYLVTLVQFDDVVEVLATAEPLATLIARAAVQHYEPRGNTALWDAFACALETETSRTEPVLCLIASDGEDNGSQLSPATAIPLIQERVSWDNWTFLWLNMQGSENHHARELKMECLDFSREDVAQVLAGIARRLGRAVQRMQLAGARRVEVAALLGRGQEA